MPLVCAPQIKVSSDAHDLRALASRFSSDDTRWPAMDTESDEEFLLMAAPNGVVDIWWGTTRLRPRPMSE